MNMFKGDRNEMFWHGVMYPCWLGQTKKVNLRIPLLFYAWLKRLINRPFTNFGHKFVIFNHVRPL